MALITFKCAGESNCAGTVKINPQFVAYLRTPSASVTVIGLSTGKDVKVIGPIAEVEAKLFPPNSGPDMLYVKNVKLDPMPSGPLRAHVLEPGQPESMRSPDALRDFDKFKKADDEQSGKPRPGSGKGSGSASAPKDGK